MHELSIAQSILEIVRQHLPEGERVREVQLQVGQLAGVVPESLEFCFEVVAAGTAIEGARLVIQRDPVRASCRECSQEFAVEQSAFVCPACGSGNLQVTSGTELRVIQIELAERGGSAS